MHAVEGWAALRLCGGVWVMHAVEGWAALRLWLELEQAVSGRNAVDAASIGR